jgi:hypothetical protein
LPGFNVPHAFLKSFALNPGCRGRCQYEELSVELRFLFDIVDCKESLMTKYLAAAAGAAIALAATFSYAQQTPPSTDRPSGQPGETTSAQPNPDKKGAGKGTKAAPKADTNTPPSTDRPSGQSGDTTSAKPKPK